MEAAMSRRPPPLIFNQGGPIGGRVELGMAGTLEVGENCAHLHFKKGNATKK